jgi:hypothetical protein
MGWMKLSQKAIDEFKAIYLAEFGKEITDEEAQKMGWNVLRLYKVLLEPSRPVQPARLQSDQIDGN